MNEVTISTPYDIIVQQQIDIIAKCQKEVLEGKENTLIELGEAVQLLVTIRNCIPSPMPMAGVGILGGLSGNRFRPSMTVQEAKARLGDDYASV